MWYKDPRPQPQTFYAGAVCWIVAFLLMIGVGLVVGTIIKDRLIDDTNNGENDIVTEEGKTIEYHIQIEYPSDATEEDFKEILGELIGFASDCTGLVVSGWFEDVDG